MKPVSSPTSAAGTPAGTAPRSTIGCALRHVAEDVRRTRLAFDEGVRWFGRDIQLNWAHITLFVTVPLAAVYMGRGLPTFYLAVLYFTLMTHHAAHLTGRARAGDPAPALRAAPSMPLLLATVVFCLYALVSSSWSPDPLNSLEEGLRLVFALVLMVPLIRLMPPREHAWHLYLPVAGLGLALSVLILEFSPVPLLREILYGPNPAFMNRAVVIAGFMLWPTLAAVGGRHAKLQRLLLIAVAATAIYSSQSQASMLAFATGSVAALLAVVAPRILAWIIGLGTAAAFAAAPIVAPQLGRILYLVGLEPYLDASNERRLEIWQAFSDVVWQRPIFGWGIKSSYDFGLLPIADVQWIVGPTHHPHNTLIQTWTELGAVGVALGVLLVVLLTRAIFTLPAARRPFAFGSLVSGLTIAAVSHGMWQSWWICLILAGIAILTIEDRVARSDAAR